ncbi:uncharacterized protein [Euwallacea similis]|uniref:uncharacterized protein n=1 Tax=Euwallacea similis TaxID=1736056 RepID=UPI00344FED55
MASLKMLRIQLPFYISILLVNSGVSSEGPGNVDSESLISTILRHLNANPNNVYNYNRGSLLDLHRKPDVIETTTEVEVSCNNRFPGIPCNDAILICHSYLSEMGTSYLILGDVRCNPKIDITIEDFDNEKTVPLTEEDQSVGIEKLDLSHEALPPEQENPDFVAVRRETIPCLGCPFDLNKDVEGVDELVNTAIKHIESEKTNRYKITNIRRLQQQIVAGVKYILLADVAGTTCTKDADLSAPCALDTTTDPFICEVVFIEQPWISKKKQIIKNNCTVSQEFVALSERNDISNEIVPHKDLIFPNPNRPRSYRPNYDAMAKTGILDQQFDADLLASLESQILPESSSETSRKAQVSEQLSPRFMQQETINGDEPPVINSNVNNLKLEPLNNVPEPQLRTLFVSMPIIEESEPVVMTYKSSSQYSGLFDEPDMLSSLETFRNHYIDGDDVFVRYVRGSKDNSEEQETKSNKSKSDSSSSEEIKSKKGNSSEQSKSDSSSEEKIENHQQETTLVIENNNISVVKLVEEYKPEDSLKSDTKSKNKSDNKTSWDSGDSIDSFEADNRRRNKRSAYLRNQQSNRKWKRSVGQLEKVPPEEKIIVRDLADFAANTLDNIDDDNHKRVILQILGAKKLKLEGTYYQIILRLGISQCQEHEHHENCREKLFTNLTKICKVQVHVDDDYSNPKVVKSQCQNIKKDENDRNRTNYSRYRRQILGGVSPLDVDNPDVKKFLSTTLLHLDFTSVHPNKHKTVEVVSASSQVVAGIEYIIKAKIGLTKCRKTDQNLADTCDLLEGSDPEICIVEVWDRPWLNRTIYNITCDQKEFSFENEPTSRSKRSFCAGCATSFPKQEAQVYLQNALILLDTTSSADQKYLTVNILESSTQVVAGRLQKIKAEIALSNCSKSNVSESDHCTKLEGTPSRICTFFIWDKPWVNFTQTRVNCEGEAEQTFRSKREVVGHQYIPVGRMFEHEKGELYRNVQNVARKAMQQFFKKMGSKRVFTIEYVTGVFSFRFNSDAEGDVVIAKISSCLDMLCESLTCAITIQDQLDILRGAKYTIKCDTVDQKYTFRETVKYESEKERKQAFGSFVKKFNKTYKSKEEYKYRLKVFGDNVNKIARLNEMEIGTAEYGITQFADLTEEEFSKSHGYRPDLRTDNELPFSQASIPDIVAIPKEFDWRTKGAVTEVKNQEACGSCWAFSVTGNVEGQYAIKHGKLLEFSEQELVDCDKIDQGCDGGLMDSAYRVIEQLGGLESESDYPYEGIDDKCSFNANKIKVKLTGALNISHNEINMAKWLVANGPISIAINANAMQFYFGGVSHPFKVLCSPNNLDHGVLIVGYGVDTYKLFNKTLPYWIVKNSWGKVWGEQGYYRVYRGDGTCGLNQTPSSAIVA